MPLHTGQPLPLTFELVRISTTADAPPNVTGGFDWKHQDGALLLVFDTFRTGRQPSEAMKVMQGANVRCDVALQAMVEQGNEISNRLKRAGAEVTADVLPISAIAKYPCIALRYSLPTGLIRRIQLKFASLAEFNGAYNHVHQLGLHLSAGRATSSRGSIACPPVRLAPRPHTANLPNPLSLAPQSTRPFSAQPRQHSPLKDHVFPRPDTATTSGSYEDSLEFGDIPPRRELPFSRGSDSTSRPGSRSTNAFMGPPPLPLSTRPGSNARSSHSDDLPPLPTPTIISKPVSSTPMKRPNTPKRTSSAKGGMSSRPTSTSSTGGQPLIASHHLSVLREAVQNTTNSDFTGNDSNTNEDNLAAYAAQPEDVRVNALNKRLLHYLEDPNFIALVSDMQESIARITSGSGAL